MEEAPHRNARTLRDGIIALMCVYVDAPTAAMTLGVHHIARNPAVRKRLEGEVAEIAGDPRLEGPSPGTGKCPAHTYIPFGGGPQSCQVNGIARQMFVLGIATVVQSLRQKPASDEPLKREDIGVGIADDFAVTVRARRGPSSED